MKKIMICALALALAAPAAASFAASRSDDTTVLVQVKYQDLDLKSARDAALLLKRLDNAALEACGASSFSLPDYRAAVRHSPCFGAATSRAVASIASPTLTAMYSAHTDNHALAAVDN